MMTAESPSFEGGPIMTKDPVCGMAIEESKAAATATHEGTTYYFCSQSCKEKFLQDPGRYAGSGHAGHH
jgi:YHS domain-containing protein